MNVEIPGGAFRVTSQNFGSEAGVNIGVLVLDRSKVLSNFLDNTDTGGMGVELKGAGIRVDEARAIIRNSLIADNYFTGTSTNWSRGAGISVYNGSIALINSAVSGNEGFTGNYGSGLIVNNDIDGFQHFSRDIIILNSIFKFIL